MITLIAAIGKNRELGKHGDLCFHLPEDLKYFRETTSGHIVLMGRKTWESIGMKPLKNRTNYILTTDTKPISGAHKISETRTLFSAHQDEEIFIIGGASVYAQCLPFADRLLLTEVDASDPAADVFFPDFDKSQFDRTVIRKGKDHDLAYSFVQYKRK